MFYLKILFKREFIGKKLINEIKPKQTVKLFQGVYILKNYQYLGEKEENLTLKGKFLHILFVLFTQNIIYYLQKIRYFPQFSE